MNNFYKIEVTNIKGEDISIFSVYADNLEELRGFVRGCAMGYVCKYKYVKIAAFTESGKCIFEWEQYK